MRIVFKFFKTAIKREYKNFSAFTFIFREIVEILRYGRIRCYMKTSEYVRRNLDKIIFRLPSEPYLLDEIALCKFLHTILFPRSAKAKKLTFRFSFNYFFFKLFEFLLAFVTYRRIYRTSARKRNVLKLLTYLTKKYFSFCETNLFYENIAVIPLERQLPIARQQDTLVRAFRLRHQLQDSGIFVVRPVRIAAHHALRGIIPFVQVLERHPRSDEIRLAAHAEHRGADALAERRIR